MSKLSTCLKTLVAAATIAATAAAVATPIIGTAQMTFGLVRVTPGNIDWNPSIDPPPNILPTYGDFSTFSGANTGSFATGSMVGLTTTNKMHDLSSVVGDANYMPIGAGTLVNAIKFAAHDGVLGTHWMFTATGLSSGDFPGAPYVLSESIANGTISTSATLSLTGQACDDVNNNNICEANEDKTKFTAILSAQYPGQSIQDLIDILSGVKANQQGVFGELDNNTWSGTLIATRLPEPASLALVGMALVGLGVAGRRRKAK